MPLVPQDWGRHTSAGTVVTVRVQPKASRTECAGLHGGAVKIRVAAPPVEGAANEALTRFLAERLDLPLRDVVIQSGKNARLKQVLLRGTTLHVVQERLGL